MTQKKTTNWSFLREPEEGYLAGSYAVKLALELLKLKSIQEKSYSNDKEMEYYQSSQYGMMSQPSESTIQNAENISSSYNQSKMTLQSRVDSLVKIYLQQVRGQGLQKILDLDYGLSLPESFAKYDPQESLWKTHQFLLLGGLESFSETWPKWGMMQNGECWELSMSEHLINVRESGYQQHWPTPCATDYKGSGKTGQLRDRLDYAVERGATKSKVYFPTPGTTGMSNGSGNCEKINQLAEQGHVTEEERRSMRSGNGGQLNPDWVEWLMNWPIKWTDLKPMNKDYFDEWRCKTLRDVWWSHEPQEMEEWKTGQYLEESEVLQQQMLRQNERIGKPINSNPEKKRSAEIKSGEVPEMRVREKCAEASCKEWGNDLMPKMPHCRAHEGWIVGTPRVTKLMNDRINRLKAIGNGQVPQCVFAAWGILG